MRQCPLGVGYGRPHRAEVGQEETLDPKARIVGNRVTMGQPVGAIKATLGGYF